MILTWMILGMTSVPFLALCAAAALLTYFFSRKKVTNQLMKATRGARYWSLVQKVLSLFLVTGTYKGFGLWWGRSSWAIHGVVGENKRKKMLKWAIKVFFHPKQYYFILYISILAQIIDYIWLTESTFCEKIYLIWACRDLWAWGKRETDEEDSTFWKGWRETWSQCPGSLYSSILNWKPVKQSTKADKVTLQPALVQDIEIFFAAQHLAKQSSKISGRGKWCPTQQLMSSLVIYPTAVHEHTHHQNQ